MTKPYLLSYDLKAPGRNYQNLYDLLERLDAVRILESVWLLDTHYNATQLESAFNAVTDSNDQHCIIELEPRSDYAAYALKAGVQFLNRHVGLVS